MHIPLENHLCFKLYVASRLIIQSFAGVLAEFDLTYPKYLVLAALVERDGQTVGELGKRLFLDSGTLSPLLKSLEAGRYIRRQRSPADDRVVDNFLTQEGRNAHAKAMAGAAEVFCRAEMSEKQFQDFGESLDDFIVRCQQLLAFASAASSSSVARANQKAPAVSKQQPPSHVKEAVPSTS